MLNRLLACLPILVLLGCVPSEPTDVAVAPVPDKTEAIAQKATTGVGKQGQSLKDNTGVGGMISGPVSAMFQTKQKVVFEIAIPQALNLFQALEGRMPKSHEEFMEKIITANRIQLPELPEGQVYRFNVEQKELWVYPETDAP